MKLLQYLPHVLYYGWKILLCSIPVLVVAYIAYLAPPPAKEGDLRSGPPDWSLGADVHDYGYIPLPSGKIIQIPMTHGSGVSWHELRRERSGDKIDVMANITIHGDAGATSKLEATVIAHYRYVPLEGRNPTHWWQVVSITVLKFKELADE